MSAPIGPSIPPSPIRSPVMGPGPLGKPSIYERMRENVLTILGQNQQAQELARIIKAENQSFASTDKQEAAFKQALLSYLKFTLSEGIETGTFIEKTQPKVLNAFNETLRKEQLPFLLAHLLTHERLGDSYQHLIPFIQDGKLKLDLTEPKELAIYKKSQSYLSLFSSFSGKDLASFKDISLSQLRNTFDSTESYQRFLIDWFTRAVAANPSKCNELVAFLSPIYLDPHKPTPLHPLLAKLVDILVPKIVDKVLAAPIFSNTLYQTLIDTSAGVLKEHLDFVIQQERKLGNIREQIDWLKKGLLNGRIQSTATPKQLTELRAFSEKVWGHDLLNLSAEDVRHFFDQKASEISDREKNYLEEARFQLMDVGKPYLDDNLLELHNALNARKLPTGPQLDKLNLISKDLWGVGFEELHSKAAHEKHSLIVLPAYKKALQKQMATVVGEILGSGINTLITPALILETLKELMSSSAWENLETQFPPPLRLLKKQVLEQTASPDDMVDFLTFIQKGLPNLVKGTIVYALQTKIASDIFSPLGISKLFEEKLLPPIIDAIYGMVITDTIKKHQHTLVEALVNRQNSDFEDPYLDTLVLQVESSFNSLIKDEDLTLPDGLDVEKVVKDTVYKLRKGLQELYEKNYDETALRGAIVAYLDTKQRPSPPPGEEFPLYEGEFLPVYPELVLTVLLDLVGLPPYLKGVIEKMAPGYPHAASWLSYTVTNAIAPYRKGHGEIVRILTSIFQNLTPSDATKAVRPFNDLVKETSMVAGMLLRERIGIGPLYRATKHVYTRLVPDEIQKMLPSNGPIEAIVQRALKHPFLTNPVYHQRLLIDLASRVSVLGGSEKNE